MASAVVVMVEVSVAVVVVVVTLRPFGVRGGASVAAAEASLEGVLSLPPDSPQAPTLAVGGRLQRFAAEWEKVTSDPWVLSVVRYGLRIIFTSPPPQRCQVRVTPLPREMDKRDALLKELTDLLNKRAVVRIRGSVRSLSNQEGYFSTFFLTPRKSGAWRPILNLKPLNVYMRPPCFKMETLAAILLALRSGYWAASLDLKDAYLHVPMHSSARRWLRFHLNGAPYEFRVLPFGLSAAPRTFTMVVRAVAEFLRERGIRIFVYLDDWLIVAPSRQLLLEDILVVREVVSRLGFVINLDKSTLMPTQRIEYLGAWIDFSLGRVFPTAARINSITQCADRLILSQSAEARLLLRMLGLMASFVDILPLCRMRMRPLQAHLLQHYRAWVHPLSQEIPIPSSLHPSLIWWSNPDNFREGMPFPPTLAHFTLTTDASKQGWGAHLLNHRLSGLWSRTQARRHINVLELWAVFLALRRLRRLVRGKKVAVRSDNQTVVSYINKQGGTRSPSLCLEVCKLLSWCRRWDISLIASFLPGQDNTIADRLSRRLQKHSTRDRPVRGSSVEWRLNPRVCKQIFRLTVRPHVDLFASPSNHQLSLYYSRGADPGAIGGDALLQDWVGLVGYAFPPIALIPRVLSRIAQTNSCLILLVAPWWPRHPWFVQLLELLVATPVRLPRVVGLLVDHPRRSPVPLRTLRSLRLTVWTLSSSPSRRRAFLGGLPPSHQRQGDLLPDTLTIRGWSGSGPGVATDRLVRSRPL